MANKVAESSKKGKPRGKAFQKGKSGNPGGRPKLPEDMKHVRELARLYTEQAVETLVSVMSSGSPPAKVAAANAILDRGWGKCEQPLTGPGENGEHLFQIIERRIVRPGS